MNEKKKPDSNPQKPSKQRPLKVSLCMTSSKNNANISKIKKLRDHQNQKIITPNSNLISQINPPINQVQNILTTNQNAPLIKYKTTKCSPDKDLKNDANVTGNDNSSTIKNREKQKINLNNINNLTHRPHALIQTEMDSTPEEIMKVKIIKKQNETKGKINKLNITNPKFISINSKVQQNSVGIAKVAYNTTNTNTINNTASNTISNGNLNKINCNNAQLNSNMNSSLVIDSGGNNSSSFVVTNNRKNKANLNLNKDCLNINVNVNVNVNTHKQTNSGCELNSQVNKVRFKGIQGLQVTSVTCQNSRKSSNNKKIIKTIHSNIHNEINKVKNQMINNNLNPNGNTHTNNNSPVNVKNKGLGCFSNKLNKKNLILTNIARNSEKVKNNNTNVNVNVTNSNQNSTASNLNNNINSNINSNSSNRNNILLASINTNSKSNNKINLECLPETLKKEIPLSTKNSNLNSSNAISISKQNYTTENSPKHIKLDFYKQNQNISNNIKLNIEEKQNNININNINTHNNSKNKSKSKQTKSNENNSRASNSINDRSNNSAYKKDNKHAIYSLKCTGIKKSNLTAKNSIESLLYNCLLNKKINLKENNDTDINTESKNIKSDRDKEININVNIKSTSNSISKKGLHKKFNLHHHVNNNNDVNININDCVTPNCVLNNNIINDKDGNIKLNNNINNGNLNTKSDNVGHSMNFELANNASNVNANNNLNSLNLNVNLKDNNCNGGNKHLINNLKYLFNRRDKKKMINKLCSGSPKERTKAKDIINIHYHQKEINTTNNNNVVKQKHCQNANTNCNVTPIATSPNTSGVNCVNMNPNTDLNTIIASNINNNTNINPGNNIKNLNHPIANKNSSKNNIKKHSTIHSTRQTIDKQDKKDKIENQDKHKKFDKIDKPEKQKSPAQNQDFSHHTNTNSNISIVNQQSSNVCNNICSESNTNLHHKVTSPKESIDPSLTLISESSSSTKSLLIKEGKYFSRESEKLSSYIKKYYKKYGEYPKTTLSFYKFGRLIGKGAFGKVNLGLHVLTGRIVAIKSFNKKNFESTASRSKIYHEVNLMKTLHHSSIVRIFETLETEKYILIIMENISGGDLLNFVKKRTKLSEKIARFIFRQLILSLKYIHSHNIIHRDIKLDNILIDLNNNIKLCDFGVGKQIHKGDILIDQCGTPAYIAPEILKNEGYEGPPVDIWSSGVVLYTMLSGTVPFKSSNLSELNRIIQKGIYKDIKDISDEARGLIKELLEVDPKKRITIDKILNHPWITGYGHLNNNCNNEAFGFNGNKISLFTKAELILLSKVYLDYRNCNKEDIIENFDIKNLFTINDYSNKNVCTKSAILTPYNSSFCDSKDNDGKNKLNNFINYYSKLKIEKNAILFSDQAKVLNRNYELNNNFEIDHGILINNSKNNMSKNSEDNKIFYDLNKNNENLNIKQVNQLLSDLKDKGIDNKKKISQPISTRSIYNYNNKIDNELPCENNSQRNVCSLTNSSTQLIDEGIIKIVEKLGYNKEYVQRNLTNNEINYATAAYYLMCNCNDSYY